MEDSEEDRRAGFVDSLLKADQSSSTASDDVVDCSLPENFQKLHVEDYKNSTVAASDSLIDSMFFLLCLFALSLTFLLVEVLYFDTGLTFFTSSSFCSNVL